MHSSLCWLHHSPFIRFKMGWLDAYTYLTFALVSAAIAILIGVIGPLAGRWRDKLEKHIERLQKDEHRHS